ncbi:hypothetical protein GLYMA_16G094250v4 [Glycine max]|nr:hypothetical protein GLYMA_16G094250v4 [Glycine max]KAH1150691.1 hypothetical protein GYH30_044616 [Glycine max]
MIFSGLLLLFCIFPHQFFRCIDPQKLLMHYTAYHLCVE